MTYENYACNIFYTNINGYALKTHSSYNTKSNFNNAQYVVSRQHLIFQLPETYQ